MRKSFTVIAALAATLSIAGPASAASRSPLKARQVEPSADWIGQADATHVAYRTTARGPDVVVAGDDGVRRGVAPLAGCLTTVAGSGLLAATCGEDAVHGGQVTRDLAVLRLDGTVVTRFTAVGQTNGADGGSAGEPSAIGTQWIRSATGSYHGGRWWEDVNWHTGEVRQSLDSDPRMIGDLDAPALEVPLCAPLRRVPIPVVDGGTDFDLNPATARGAWALIWGSDGATLRHCGLARPVKLPSGFRPEVLGDGWVAGTVPVAHRSPRVALVRLSDRRRFVVTGVPGDQAKRGALDFAFTRGRFYVHGDDGFVGLRPLLSVTLPRAG